LRRNWYCALLSGNDQVGKTSSQRASASHCKSGLSDRNHTPTATSRITFPPSGFFRHHPRPHRLTTRSRYPAPPRQRPEGPSSAPTLYGQQNMLEAGNRFAQRRRLHNRAEALNARRAQLEWIADPPPRCSSAASDHSHPRVPPGT
jgi:hypothetical protein